MLDQIAFLYRDPLFGVAILMAIIVILVFADYGRNKYRAKKHKIALENFTKSYHENSLSDEFVDFLSLAKDPIPPLLLLAKTYARAGDSTYAIKIYLEILEKTKNTQEKIIILESLGITYFEAGFLQRAKNIFLEILKTYPRNAQILGYLVRTHESMGEYQDALDVLECLNEISTPKMRQESANIKAYLHFMLLINSHILSLNKKNKEVISLMHYNNAIRRVAFDYLFLYARELFWEEILKVESVEFCLDILWRFSKEEVPFEMIAKHGRRDILDVFVAKGYLDSGAESSIATSADSNLSADAESKAESNFGAIAESKPDSSPKTAPDSTPLFELEVLRVLFAHSKQRGDLVFEYRCHHCKNIFPFDSFRCPMCASVAEMDLIYKIKEATAQNTDKYTTIYKEINETA